MKKNSTVLRIIIDLICPILCAIGDITSVIKGDIEWAILFIGLWILFRLSTVRYEILTEIRKNNI